MVTWNTIRNRIPGMRSGGAANIATNVNTNIGHGGPLGPRPGNDPPNRFRSFVNTVIRRRQQNPVQQAPQQNAPQITMALTITPANVPLPDFDFDINHEVNRRMAAAQKTSIFDGLPKVEDLEKKTRKLEGTRQTIKVPVYRPDTFKSAEAVSSKAALPGKPLGHLPQRSYNQVMQILGQPDSASPLGIPTLITNLDKEIDELETYKAQVKQALDDNKQPGNAIGKNDVKYARHVVAMYNADNPKLHAEVFNSPPDLIQYIKENIDDFSRLRALFRMGSTSGILHHAAADIRVKDGKATIVCADPANFTEQNIFRSVMAMDDALEDLPPEKRECGYVGVGAQNSPNDCVIFGESFLKKMDDEEEFFDKMHDKLYNGQPLNSDAHIKPRKADKEEAMDIAEEMFKDGLKNISQISPDARHFFPLSFYKHSHSPKDVGELLGRQPEKSETKVNKAHPDRPAQTLPERVDAHIPEDGRKHGDGTFKYSISIEEKRLDEIDKTIEFFRGLKKTLVSAE
jgi:hypothetical protein